jgi:hypothetical protein
MHHSHIRRPRFERLEPKAGAVRLYDHNDYTGWFMPQGWEFVAEREAEGLHHSSPYSYARNWAAALAQKAMQNPLHGAVMAVGYIARRMGEISPPDAEAGGDFREAAE